MASIVAASVAVPSFCGLKAQTYQKVAVKSTSVVVKAAPVASLKNETLKKVATTLFATGASLFLAANADAALVKMGADDGQLLFVPGTLTVGKGEPVTFKNNAGFPHNVVFDEDAVPSGVKVDSINHEDYFNAPGEVYTIELKIPGTYEYSCEPHAGAGMKGVIVVE